MRVKSSVRVGVWHNDPEENWSNTVVQTLKRPMSKVGRVRVPCPECPEHRMLFADVASVEQTHAKRRQAGWFALAMLVFTAIQFFFVIPSLDTAGSRVNVLATMALGVSLLLLVLSSWRAVTYTGVSRPYLIDTEGHPFDDSNHHLRRTSN